MKEQYEQALNDYFNTLDELDKIHGLQYKTNQRHKLRVKLKALSNKCKDIEGQLSKQNEIYFKQTK